MGDLYKGYVETKNKKCVEKFKDRTDFKTLEQVQSLPEYAGILAKNTITSMQAGLLYGTIGQTEYIIRKMKEESAIENIKVVATGGLGRSISDATELIDIYDPNLTLQGTRLIYEKTKAAEKKKGSTDEPDESR